MNWFRQARLGKPKSKQETVTGIRRELEAIGLPVHKLTDDQIREAAARLSDAVGVSGCSAHELAGALSKIALAGVSVSDLHKRLR